MLWFKTEIQNQKCLVPVLSPCYWQAGLVNPKFIRIIDGIVWDDYFIVTFYLN